MGWEFNKYIIVNIVLLHFPSASWRKDRRGSGAALSSSLWPVYWSRTIARWRTSTAAVVVWWRWISSCIVRWRWGISGWENWLPALSSGTASVTVVISVWRICPGNCTHSFAGCHFAVISIISIQVNHTGRCIYRFWIGWFYGINCPGVVIWVIIITIIRSFTGSIIIGTVAVIIIIPEISPATVTYAHADLIINRWFIPYFVPVITVIILFFFNNPHRRIIYIIGSLATFISGAATA